MEPIFRLQNKKTGEILPPNRVEYTEVFIDAYGDVAFFHEGAYEDDNGVLIDEIDFDKGKEYRVLWKWK